MTAAAADRVEAALPPERRRPAEEYPVDGLIPRIAFRPRTADEVATLLHAADAADVVVVPLGARTALRLGRPLARYDVALDTTALNRVVAYEPEDLTVTVEAGITLKALQSVLGERGQYLPVDPPPDDRVTVGGLLATARPGAWRGHLPAARDLVLGATVATPQATLVHSGGRVVKNVSGYDMHRMHTGALGAFGVIVEASFKVAPLPAGRRTFVLECAHLEQASELAFALWDRALPLRGLALLSNAAAAAAGLPAAPHVLIEGVGRAAVLHRVADAVKTQAALLHAVRGVEPGDAPWTQLRTLAGPQTGCVVRLGVPASRVAAAVEAASEAGCVAWGYLASGSVLATAASLDTSTVERLRAHAVEAGGFLQIEAADASLRATADPFATPERDLVRALKAQFDPRGTINRGRWMEGV
ncbi:MAG: FAD-binding protein [Dehalococcoidia bacterium]